MGCTTSREVKKNAIVSRLSNLVPLVSSPTSSPTLNAVPSSSLKQPIPPSILNESDTLLKRPTAEKVITFQDTPLQSTNNTTKSLLKGTNSAKSITFEDDNTTNKHKSTGNNSNNSSANSLLTKKYSGVNLKVRIDEDAVNKKKHESKSPKPPASSVSSTGGHERQKSVTGEKLSLDDEQSVPRRQSSGYKHALHENFAPMNPLNAKIRDFYSGVDDAEENIIGSGNWGVVKVITRIRDNRKFACKIVQLNDEKQMTDEHFLELRAEIDALRQLDHVAIAKLYETFEEPGEYLYLVMELLTGGELYTALVEKSPTGRFDEIRTRRLIKKMISALAYLHDKGLVHRDIKLENFCFRGNEDEDEIVLIDFGLAKLYELRHQATEIVGSSYYIAPEIIEGTYVGPTPDMWSMGVILFMMLAGRPPFDGSSDQNIMRRTARGKFHMDDEVWKTQVSSHAQDFVKRCLTLKPADRITSKEALKHPFLTMSDEALIDCGAGDDPARALAPAVIPSVVSQQLNNMRLTRKTSALGEGNENQKYLALLQTFASRHELVRIFSQAVAFCLGREEVRELTKLFVNLDRDQDGLITAIDIEVVLMGATEAEVAEETRIVSRNSLTDHSARMPSSTNNGKTTQKFFHSIDDATRFRRKRRREANYMFAAMDVQKRNVVSLNEFIAATLNSKFYQDEQLLTDAFCRLCKRTNNGQVASLRFSSNLLEGVLGGRYNEKRARRLVGEFVAIARFPKTPTALANTTSSSSFSGGGAAAAAESPKSGLDRLRKFGSFTANSISAHSEDITSLSSQRVDVDFITFDDFFKAMSTTSLESAD